MDSKLEKQLEEARLRNKERYSGKTQEPEKRKPRYLTEVSEVQLERLTRRHNKRLANAAPRVVELNKRQYKHGTGAKKNVKQYGLTREAWFQLVEKHGSRCGICGKEEPRPSALAIDHDHRTGKIRGLLCRHCNAGLGQFRDDIELLAKATIYLKKNSSG